MDRMKILGAALLYFAIVFGTGFLVGPLRVLYAEPRVGTTAAVLLEVPILLVAMIVGATIAVRWLDAKPSTRALVTVGTVSLVFQHVADVAVGVLLRGMSVEDHLAQFATTPRMIYGALLVAFALMPLLMRRRRAVAERVP